MVFYNKKKAGGKSTTIIVVDNNVEKAISKLKHAIAPIMKELKERRAYEKPSEKKRRKKKEGIRNSRKRQRLMAEQW